MVETLSLTPAALHAVNVERRAFTLRQPPEQLLSELPGRAKIGGPLTIPYVDDCAVFFKQDSSPEKLKRKFCLTPAKI